MNNPNSWPPTRLCNTQDLCLTVRRATPILNRPPYLDLPLLPFRSDSSAQHHSRQRHTLSVPQLHLRSYCASPSGEDRAHGRGLIQDEAEHAAVQGSTVTAQAAAEGEQQEESG